TGTEYALASSNSALPVTLGPLTAKTLGNDILIEWNTHTETNNSGFYIERSADGITFATLAFGPSKADGGNSVADLAYSYTDRSPLAGNNHYRLKQVDYDGRHTHSGIVSVKKNAGNFYLQKLYPNPVGGQRELNVYLQSESNSSVMLSVSDLS